MTRKYWFSLSFIFYRPFLPDRVDKGFIVEQVLSTYLLDLGFIAFKELVSHPWVHLVVLRHAVDSLIHHNFHVFAMSFSIFRNDP